MYRPSLLSRVPNVALVLSLLLAALGPLPPAAARAAFEPTAGPALSVSPAGMLDTPDAAAALPLAVSAEDHRFADHTEFTVDQQRAALQPCVAPAALDVSGPDIVFAGTTNTYTATVLTTDATLPISYTWEYYPELAAPEVQVVDATQSILSLTSSVTGTRPITVTAENCGGAVTTVGEVIVQDAPLPDLVVTDIWPGPSSAFFQIHNAGQDTAAPGYTITLEIDGSLHQTDVITVELAPGERFAGEFGGRYICSGFEDKILATVDAGDLVAEEAEDNNGRDELWRCDTQPPEITSGPAATVLGPSSAAIEWETNEDSDSTVHYSQQAGEAYDHQEYDATLTQSHYVTLTDLSAGVYQYAVASTDESGNEVVSDEHFFEILPPGGAPDVDGVDIERRSGVNPIYDITAFVPNPSGVERAEFYLDGKHVGTDYSPSVVDPLEDAAYGYGLVPYLLGMNREDFFGEHEGEVHVFDYQNGSTDVVFDLHPITEDMIVELQIITPQPNDIIAIIEGVSLPDPTNVEIEVKAVAYEWWCQWLIGRTGEPDYNLPPDCGDQVELLTSLHLHVYDELGNAQHNDFYTPTPGQETVLHTFTWNAGGLWPGSYRIEVEALASDGSQHTAQVVVEVLYADPSLQVSRDVTLGAGNTFATVELTIENHPQAVATVYVERVTDWLKHMQPAERATANYTVQSAYDETYRLNQADIELFSSTGEPPVVGPLALAPGEAFTIEYFAVPILYDNGPIDLVIGIGPVEVHYTYETGDIPYSETFMREYELSAYEAEQLTQAADYIIATNPGRLFTLPGGSQTDALLGTMAHLAQLKQGVLGYLDDYTGSEYALDELIEIGGFWAEALNIYRVLFPRFYLLIVGEREIVPSWTEDGFDYTRLPEWEENDYETVDLSDQPYAMLPASWWSGGYPQVRVGRIIGNEPDALRKPILASIAVEEGTGLTFDRSHAFLLSGEGNVQYKFRDSNRNLEEFLKAAGTEVTAVHGLDYYVVQSFDRDYGFDELASGDVNGDGRDEIVIADNNEDRIYVLNAQGTELGSFAPRDALGTAMAVDHADPMAVGDVVGDATEEIVFVRAGRVYYYDETGSPVGTTWDTSDPTILDVQVGDADGDGEDELVFASDTYPGTTLPGHIHGYTPQGTHLYSFFPNYEYGDRLAVGDIITGPPEAQGDELILADHSADQILLYNTGANVLHQQHFVIDEGDDLAVGRVIIGFQDQIIFSHPVSDTVFVLNWDASIGQLAYQQHIFWEPLLLHTDVAAGDLLGTTAHEVIIGDRYNQILISDDSYCQRIEAAVATSGGLVDHDVLYYLGHGLTNDWACGLNTLTVPANFGSAAPVAFAPSCLTGNYEAIIDEGIAEAFLASGAAVYIGSTQVSVVADMEVAGRRFFGLWDDSESAGDAWFQLELGKWAGRTDQQLFWVWEYNVYGDPKFGATSAGGGAGTGAVQALSTPSSLHVEIPSYTVTQRDGYDHVEIPDGQMLIEAGTPMVPYWPVMMTYPAGEMVQDVLLAGRSEAETETSLKLPYPDLNHGHVQTAVAQTPGSIQAAGDGSDDSWVPDPAIPYDWSTWDNADGTSTLLINVYPILYNPLRADLEFHRHFSFTIETHTSTVPVDSLQVAQAVYPQGGEVKARLWLTNSGAPKDVIVHATVRHALTGELVQGLPLRNLHNVAAPSLYDLVWDGSGFPAGRYYLDVELRDMEGNVLDQAAAGFQIGEASAEITSLTATPEVFRPGEAIGISMVVHNNATLPIDGTAFIQVLTSEGHPVETFTHPVVRLGPDGSLRFDNVWDTAGASRCRYVILGYLTFDSKTTDIARVEVEQVGSQALLALSKSDRRDPVPATWWAHYDIALTNNGEGATGEVLLTDTIPQGMYFVDTPANEGWTLQGGVVTRRVTSLLPGASVHFPLVLGTHSSARGTVTNTVVAEWGCAEVTASESTTIGGWQPPLPCPDPYEPNESLADAWMLGPGSHWSYICCTAPADDDYFSFAVQAGEQIELRLSQLPDNYQLCLIGPDGAELQCSTNPATAAEDIIHLALVSGEYVARVYGYNRTACDSTVPYKLDIGVIPAVVEPTPTATPTATVTPATPTPTGTPTPNLLYLPMVMKSPP